MTYFIKFIYWQIPNIRELITKDITDMLDKTKHSIDIVNKKNVLLYVFPTKKLFNYLIQKEFKDSKTEDELEEI